MVKKKSPNYFQAFVKSYDIVQILLLAIAFSMLLVGVNYFENYSLTMKTAEALRPLYQGFVISVFAFVYIYCAISIVSKEINISDFLLSLGFLTSLISILAGLYFSLDQQFVLFYVVMALVAIVIMVIRLFLFKGSETNCCLKNYFSQLATNPFAFLCVLIGSVLGFCGFLLLDRVSNDESLLPIVNLLGGLLLGVFFSIIIDSLISRRVRITIVDYLLMTLLVALTLSGAFFLDNNSLIYKASTVIMVLIISITFVVRSVFYKGLDVSTAKYKINRYFSEIAKKYHITLVFLLGIFMGFYMLVYDLIGIKNAGTTMAVVTILIFTVYGLVGLFFFIRDINVKDVTILDYLIIIADCFVFNCVIILFHQFSVIKLLGYLFIFVIMLIITLVRVSIFENGIEGIINSLDEVQESNPYDYDEYIEYKERRKKRKNVKQSSYLFPNSDEDLFYEDESSPILDPIMESKLESWKYEENAVNSADEIKLSPSETSVEDDNFLIVNNEIEEELSLFENDLMDISVFPEDTIDTVLDSLDNNSIIETNIEELKFEEMPNDSLDNSDSNVLEDLLEEELDISVPDDLLEALEPEDLNYEDEKTSALDDMMVLFNDDLEKMNKFDFGEKIDFEDKLKNVSEKTLEYYSRLKNILLKYRHSNRLSKRYETFKKQNSKVILSIGGKTLKAYLAIDPNSIDEKNFHQINVSDIKQYQDVPCMIKIKNEKICKNVESLLISLFDNYGFKVKKDYVEEDFSKFE